MPIINQQSRQANVYPFSRFWVHIRPNMYPISHLWVHIQLHVHLKFRSRIRILTL